MTEITSPLMLREMRVTYHPERSAKTLMVDSPRTLAALLVPSMGSEVVEIVKAIYFTTRHTVIAAMEVARGGIDAVTVQPQDVLRGAILANAAGIVLAHNHPSGDPTPSPEDVAFTTRIQNAVSIVGIELLDHIIIGDNRYFSFKEAGMLTKR